jgi:hypothetical protein
MSHKALKLLLVCLLCIALVAGGVWLINLF